MWLQGNDGLTLYVGVSGVILSAAGKILSGNISKVI